ncbi:MAG: class I SAM-dependent methyltransferase [Actinomycetota bacterium]|nr:class I SAM-dependent methyltransferase [Actinomycetota bacterium]
MREQRLVFGEVPELYDRVRPGYSGAVVDDVLTFGGLEAATCRALEVGAGTGKATVAFASRGVGVHALEPDPAMAAVASRNCRRYPHVEVEISSFEDWDLREGAFDLVFSAQAWHWVSPEVRCTRARAALDAGGSLALLWHRVSWDADDPVRVELDACYRRFAPELHARQPGFPGHTWSGSEGQAQQELSSCAGFDDVAVHEHRWTQSLDAAAYLDRLRTQSDHRLLPAAELERLLEAVRAVIDARGGAVTVPHSTLIVLARRR